MGFSDALKRVNELEAQAQPISTEDTPLNDFFEESVEDINSFDKSAWQKGKGYKLPNYPMVEERLEGLDEGLYLFAAESNVGKSAAMMNIIYDACTCPENKLFGIYYSLDDSKYDIIPRVVALDQSIPISVVSKPQRYQAVIDEGGENSGTYQKWIEKRSEGLQKLRDNKNVFKIEDGNRIKSADEMYDHMKKLQVYIKAMDPQANIIVAIDAVDDIRFKDMYFNNASDRHAEIAKRIKEWSTELHIPIFGSRHLRKINANRRPTLDDLKDSIEYVYEASVVWLLYNDVSKNKQSAKIFYDQEGMEAKSPIIELDWAKNKKSSFKGRTYGYFAPELSQLTECGKEVSKRYDGLIYEA